MKHIQIIMPEVKECSAQSCGFNKNSGCHARAITIGDNEVPGCDTFFAVRSIQSCQIHRTHFRRRSLQGCRLQIQR